MKKKLYAWTPILSIPNEDKERLSIVGTTRKELLPYNETYKTVIEYMKLYTNAIACVIHNTESQTIIKRKWVATLKNN